MVSTLALRLPLGLLTTSMPGLLSRTSSNRTWCPRLLERLWTGATSRVDLKLRCLTNRFGAILPLLITQSGPQWESILPTPHPLSPLSLLRCRESIVNPIAPLTPIRFVAGASALLTNPSSADPLVLPVLMTLKWLLGLTS